jgi:uncharacterized protein
MGVVYKQFPIESRVIDLEAGIFEITISTEEKDRQGDIVRATGGQLANYLRNPVVLPRHSYNEWPIARTLSIEVLPGRGLKSQFQFPEWKVYEEADIARRLFAGKFINAASIGFMPLESIPLEKDRPWGPQDFVSWELLEWSLVTVPANAGALAARSLGRSPVAGASGLVMQILALEEYLEKRGRVLSASNERKLREAAENITAVLSQLGEEDPEQESLPDPAAKTQSDPGEGSPVTETPEPPESTTDPTSNDLDEGVLASLSNLFDILTGA